MESLLSFLDPLLPFLLAGTAAVYLLEFLRRPAKGRFPAGRVLLGTTLGALVLRFAAFVTVHGRLPLASRGEVFTTIALSIVVVHTLLELLHRERTTGFLLFSVATLFMTLGLASPPAGSEVNEILRQPWFGVHTLSATLGYTAFAVSAVYSTLFLFLYGDLKQRRFGLLYERIPSLDDVSTMAIRSATLGFGFLTAAILVGAFLWVRTLDVPFHQDPKIVSVLIVWVVYGTGIGLHFFTRWRGIRCIGITLAAFVLMVLSSWLVPALLGSSHSLKELL